MGSPRLTWTVPKRRWRNFLARISPSTLSAINSWEDVIEWRVLPGDSLRAIAAGFATSIDALVAANWPLHPDHIYVGATLRVPRGFAR